MQTRGDAGASSCTGSRRAAPGPCPSFLSLSVLLVFLVLLVLALACAGGGGAPSGPPQTNPGTAAWHASSSPLAVEYLRTLPDDLIGKELAGILLSDGKRWLQGFTYLGRVGVVYPGMTVVSVQLLPDEPVTFVWIDDGGEPWPLPACEPVERGVRARTLSGHVYTWKALRPGAGIVSLECPPPIWPAPGSAARLLDADADADADAGS